MFTNHPWMGVIDESQSVAGFWTRGVVPKEWLEVPSPVEEAEVADGNWEASSSHAFSAPMVLRVYICDGPSQVWLGIRFRGHDQRWIGGSRGGL